MDIASAQRRLRQALLERGFSSGRADDLARLLQPCLRFETLPTSDADIGIGASKFGGEPDVPEDFDWPAFRGEPLDFLAQLDLADFVRWEAAAPLPGHGLLSFFYGVASDAYGGDPLDFGAWAVVWSPNEGLVRRPAPPSPAAGGYAERPEEGFVPCRLRVWPGFSAPMWEAHQLEPLGLSFEEWTAFYETWTQYESGPQIHQLLGYPIPVQGPMEEECHEGLSVWNPAPETGGNPLDAWRMLFQFDSDGKTGMTWGDEGRVHFWIRAADLAARRFDRAWLVTHCH